jgi:aminoglycoside phosphotransferase (APT) family kinase protein
MNQETAVVRAGEEINVNGLTRYLRSQFSNSADHIIVEQFPAGSSNLTYLIRLDDEEYVLRRPPFGNTVKTAHDMKREFDVLSKLAAVYKPAPKPELYCDDLSVIGSEFYLMERRHGLIIRGRFPNAEARTLMSVPPAVAGGDVAEGRMLVRAKSGAEDNRTLESSHDLLIQVCKSFIQNLADLHALDYEAAGLGELGKPEGYAHRQVEGWTKRYFAAKTHEHAGLESAIKWLNDNIPPESGVSLVHNDYKFDNIMLNPDDLTEIKAVLDWEMVTVGDPLMDLGTTLGYWMSSDAGDEMLNMPFNPRVLMENISRSELVHMYADASGRDVSNILFYYVFGTFKIAVIAQQIYARYVKGFTQDKRFSGFDKFVAALGQLAWKAVQTQRI